VKRRSIPKIRVLAGPNGSGKSTLFRSLRATPTPSRLAIASIPTNSKPNFLSRGDCSSEHWAYTSMFQLCGGSLCGIPCPSFSVASPNHRGLVTRRAASVSSRIFHLDLLRYRSATVAIERRVVHVRDRDVAPGSSEPPT
jgi:hypothetical protein